MGLGEVPSAMMTASASILNSAALHGDRAAAAGGVRLASSIRMQVMDWTWPFSSPLDGNGIGEQVENDAPSSLAWWTSSARAGSSASERR